MVNDYQRLPGPEMGPWLSADGHSVRAKGRQGITQHIWERANTSWPARRRHVEIMAKATYRVIIRKDGQTSDIEIAEPGRPPRIVKTFNSDAEAWEWIWKWVKEQKEERR